MTTSPFRPRPPIVCRACRRRRQAQIEASMEQKGVAMGADCGDLKPFDPKR